MEHINGNAIYNLKNNWTEYPVCTKHVCRSITRGGGGFWRFPKIVGALLGVPRRRIVVFWGLYWCPCHISPLAKAVKAFLEYGAVVLVLEFVVLSDLV